MSKAGDIFGMLLGHFAKHFAMGAGFTYGVIVVLQACEVIPK